jgi:muramoyltetrapeptide carboxypeptidase
MQQPTPFIGLIRTGSACWNDADPELVHNWLQEKHQIPAHYHPDTQKWLTPEQRANIVLEFLLDDRYTTLWVFRGGEGSADILPYLQQHAAAIKQARPKLLLGISDATAVLNYFNQVFNWPVAHSPGAVQAAKGRVNEESIALTLALIHDQQTHFALPTLTALNNAAKQQGNILAPLCGGNLSVLAISVKDIWEIQTANKILIIEELNEEAYQVARYLNYFKRIKLLDNTAAIIFGDFIFEKDQGKQEAIVRTLERFAQSCSFPVLQTTAFGHGVNCIPLPFFRPALLNLGDIPELFFN